MPGFDKSGPVGQGPMTGRQMGRCTNYGATQTKEGNNPINEEELRSNEFPRRGLGLGRRGRGLGRGNRFRGGF